MKKIIILLISLFLLTGCFKSEELDNAEIYTTVYPIEYITNELYGYNSKVSSIYPNGSNKNEYELSKKKIKMYSKKDLFIYNGLTKEKQIAASLVNKNSKLKIIDVSVGLSIKYSEQELWLNPTNYLMILENIKDGFDEYITGTNIKENINSNYENLKTTINELSTSLDLIEQNGKKNTLIVSKNYLKFLENYGFDVISLEDTDELNNDTINRALNLIKSKTNYYVYVTDEENNTYSDAVNKVISAGAQKKVLNTMSVLSEEQRNKQDNYLTLMNENLELIREEIFK